MSPAGAEDPPMLKLACLYRMKEINGGSLGRAIAFPLKGGISEPELSWRAPV
jgi:hypothetical protein